jgi:DNA-binding MarR family transcriptional regulator/ribosomal protein S18 acetylase RimI-like enzyme
MARSPLSLHSYGALLLASRMRKISEAMYGGVDAVCRDKNVTLSSSYFAIMFLLRDGGRLGISELARELGQSHPAVSQMSRKLLDAQVVREWPDPKDDRRRLLSLSPRGSALMRRLIPVWSAITAAVQEMEATLPLSDALTEIDKALSQRSFSQRIYTHLHKAHASSVTIIPFEPRYGPDFKRLNLEWLTKYFTVEPIDEAVLSRPAAILRKGGFILFARLGKRIIGTCALLKQGASRFELSKMAVTESYQGLGIGRRLLEAAIRTFATRAKGELFLETSSALAAAIKLYESVGFVHAERPTGPSHYERADVYMVYRGSPHQ